MQLGLTRIKRRADVLLIVPPFALADRPALGVHLLQGIARTFGLETQILYTNLLFAAHFGERNHSSIASDRYLALLGERLFARAAFGGPPLGRDGGRGLPEALEAKRRASAVAGQTFGVTVENIRAVEEMIPTWLDSFLPYFAENGYAVVGCSTSFEQTAASFAILHRMKRAAPKTLTIIGGANCEGDLARGIRSLSEEVDYVFSGESESTFAKFIADLRTGVLPEHSILQGTPCADLDTLPMPDFNDYYQQLGAFLPRWTHGSGTLNYETSRGCWWGEKSHCTFCGLNGEGMGSRKKSSRRVIAELQALTRLHSINKIAMTDNIMPREYFQTLLPHLAAAVPGAHIMYEQKANLNLRDVKALMRAGIDDIQPGIEALSSGLLKLMAKGTTASQNIALLRYACATGMNLRWGLLCGFPNDRLSFYEETLELLPLISHLPPPRRLNPVVIDRFSPYYRRPKEFGIAELRPLPFYEQVFPPHADIKNLAYHFSGEFASESNENPRTMHQLSVAVGQWRNRWFSELRPQLVVRRDGLNRYSLLDTRGIPGVPERQDIDECHAVAALVPRRASECQTPEQVWAFSNNLIVERDRKFVPLAIAEPDLLSELEQRYSTRLESLPLLGN